MWPAWTSADEIVAAVFGRGGLQTYHAREVINNIGFLIFDTVKGNVCIAGVSGPDNLLTMLSHRAEAACFLEVSSQPFGNEGNSSEGTPSYSSDVLAFGSIADPDMGSACKCTFSNVRGCIINLTTSCVAGHIQNPCQGYSFTRSWATDRRRGAECRLKLSLSATFIYFHAIYDLTLFLIADRCYAKICLHRIERR